MGCHQVSGLGKGDEAGGGIKPALTQAGGDTEGPRASPRAALVGAGSDGTEGCGCPDAGHREPAVPLGRRRMRMEGAVAGGEGQPLRKASGT